jgi:ATP-dependent helicase/nuclease subunit B
VAAPAGPPLLFLAPKQATFQLERQLLTHSDLPGFSRLQILSFERLAFWLLDYLGVPEPRVLGTDGRTMVLRFLLDRDRDRLTQLGAVARQPAFARDLGGCLTQLRHYGHGPKELSTLAPHPALPSLLQGKLQDLAFLQETYSAWLDSQQLTDQDELLELARLELLRSPSAQPIFDAIWMDGFAEMTPPEVALLAAVVNRSRHSTLAFCVESPDPPSEAGSIWAVVADSFRKCHAAISAHSPVVPQIQVLPRSPLESRFAASPALAHLESRWCHHHSFKPAIEPEHPPSSAIQIFPCATPHAEAELAADRIKAGVSSGLRYRDCAILVRQLDLYGPILARTLRQRGIPSFLDQRYPIRHHPLIEFTRSALRIAVNPLNDEDWFAWLKSGMLDSPLGTSHLLENQLLARRWKGQRWNQVEGLLTPEFHAQVVAPIQTFLKDLGQTPVAQTIAQACKRLWNSLGVEERMGDWDEAELDSFSHRAVYRSLEQWLLELERAFGSLNQPLRDWLPIIEAAWSGMTTGAIPPALDQVLVGAIDRSRNPDLQLVVLPGWTETQLPASPPSEGLLSRLELECLSGLGCNLAEGPWNRQSQERFYAYIALSRSRSQVIVTYPLKSGAGRNLEPSPYLRDLPFSEYGPLTAQFPRPKGISAPPVPPIEVLKPGLALALVGTRHVTSASALEQAAACPLQHALSRLFSGRQREELELDARAVGTLQHELLAAFHNDVQTSGRCWKDVHPSEGRAILGRLGLASRSNQLPPSPSARFQAQTTVQNLQSFLSTWLSFAPHWPLDPVASELVFRPHSSLPPLEIPTAGGTLELHGKIDRLDAAITGEGHRALCVVDYKLRGQVLNPHRVRDGTQLQLPLYLLAAARLDPTPNHLVGMVYAALLPITARSDHRRSGPGANPACTTFPHRGRLNGNWIKTFHQTDWSCTPFKVSFRKDGRPAWASDLVDPHSFAELMSEAQKTSKNLGKSILEGRFPGQPIANQSHETCRRCYYKEACRFRP